MMVFGIDKKMVAAGGFEPLTTHNASGRISQEGQQLQPSQPVCSGLPITNPVPSGECI